MIQFQQISRGNYQTDKLGQTANASEQDTL